MFRTCGPSRAGHGNSGGFTLIEIIAVVAIMAVLVTLIVPRMSGNERREFRLAVDRTADLLMMFAQRHNTMNNPVGILHNRSNNSLELLVVDGGESPKGGPGEWRLDHYVEPVQFPRFMTDHSVDVTLDGDRIDISEWPLMCNPGQDRPIIEIALRGGGQSAIIVLQPHGVSPSVYSTFGPGIVQRTRQDLDAAGRIREDW